MKRRFVLYAARVGRGLTPRLDPCFSYGPAGPRLVALDVLDDFDQLICGNLVEDVRAAARPANLNAVDF